LHPNLIQKLNEVFKANSGENTVTFEVMEIEKIVQVNPIVNPVVFIPEISIENEVDSDILDTQPEIEQAVVETEIPVEVDENRVVTSLSMPSRKLKVKISNELLLELERLQINFKLN
jgi:DNA polymerase-3 subunit alpha